MCPHNVGTCSSRDLSVSLLVPQGMFGWFLIGKIRDEGKGIKNPKGFFRGSREAVPLSDAAGPGSVTPSANTACSLILQHTGDGGWSRVL